MFDTFLWIIAIAAGVGGGIVIVASCVYFAIALGSYVASIEDEFLDEKEKKKVVKKETSDA